MLVGIQDEILRLQSKGLLAGLLADKTTRANIIWATDAYKDLGPAYARDQAMEPGLITGRHSDVIKTRARKAMEHQSERTRKHAEVFTPLWVCQKMLSFGDAEAFGGRDPFFTEETAAERFFTENNRWQAYVDARRLEITCGEAPFLVQRYDAATGEMIPLADRQGLLDRKLRLVNAYAEDEVTWFKWAVRAFQATYGYELTGDNLLIARVNLLMTFEDALMARWVRKPTAHEYRKIIKTIAWNIWQMDGLTGGLPFAQAAQADRQMDLFSLLDPGPEEDSPNPAPDCRIYNWRADRSLAYNDLTQGGNGMKFDFIIGNPPYQDETLGDNKGYAPPIYHLFMDAAYQVADKVELIHPARFLFNAGSTPKSWNEKMLNDKHFKIISYQQASGQIFSATDIKGGIAISYRDAVNEFGAIETFTPYDELNKILHKIINHEAFSPLSEVVSTRALYRLTDVMHKEHPEALGQLSKGHPYDMSTNIFDRLPQIFHEEKPNDNYEYIQILGRKNNSRIYQWMRKDYLKENSNIYKYKVILPKANGSGALGEVIPTPLIGSPLIGFTETFISVGEVDTREEAEAILKYIKSKFARTLLGVLKITQDNTRQTWRKVPLQDFSAKSDIDWSGSVADIDRQLYAKYGLSDEEVDFIETHVKEMV